MLVGVPPTVAAALLSTMSRPLASLWLSFFSYLAVTEAQMPMYTLEPNNNAGTGIYVVSFQGDGYARDDTSIKYNGTFQTPLMSYTFCHR